MANRDKLMTVHIRERKGKNKEIINLYLEIYKGYTKKEDGSTKAHRIRQKLDFYLYSNPKTPTQKTHNKETLQKAEIIRAEKLKDAINSKYGFKSDNKVKANFIEYFNNLTQERLNSKGNYGNWDSVLKHLKKYTGDSISFENIDTQFCKGFKEYLEKAKTKSGKILSNNSVSSYFNKFRAALNQAVEEEIIFINPSKKITLSKTIEHKREFLTEQEVQKLAITECRYDVLKRAFLFACLTGMRWSDINKLKWSELQNDGENWKVVFHQQKTKGLQYHPIPKNAKELLGKVLKGDEKIFVGLQYSSYMNVALSQWMLRAGITKQITFHCSRHTFATLLLAKGANLFTVSKLLGHSEIRTTQIYANIIDQIKNDAVNTLDIL